MTTPTQPCPDCVNREADEDPCTTCNGTGRVFREPTLDEQVDNDEGLKV